MFTLLDIFGSVKEPDALSKFGGVEGGAIGKLINFIFNTLIVAASVWALLNLILAGYAFISAGDDPKKIEAAWAKIWQTILGLAVAAGAFVLGSIFGQIIFGNPKAILSPEIPKL